MLLSTRTGVFVLRRFVKLIKRYQISHYCVAIDIQAASIESVRVKTGYNGRNVLSLYDVVFLDRKFP